MKKIYLLLTFLLTIVGGGFSHAFAQDEPITIEVKKGIGDWLYANSARTWASQWQSDATPQVLIRESSNNNSGHGANNMAYWDGTNIEFFNCIGGSGNSDTYVISVEAGWEFVSIALDFKASHADKSVYVSVENEQSEVNESTSEFVHFEYDFASETTSFNFIVGASEPSKFAMTQNFVITVQKMEAMSVALDELFTLIEAYRTYTAEGDTPFIGDGKPGNYDADAVVSFNAIFEQCETEGEDPQSVEHVQQLIALLEGAYNAVVESKVTSVPLADGYYRIRTGINYNDGEMKYIYVQPNSDATISGKWGTVADLETDCPSLWQVTNVGDGVIDIVSMAMDARFDDHPSTLSMQSENMMVLEPAATIDDVTYVNILYAGKESGSYNYIHQAGHASGAGTGGNLTVWVPSYPAATSNKMGGSEWVFEPVDENLALAIIAAYAPIKEREQLLNNFKKTYAEAKQDIADAKDIQEYTDLITDGNEQFSSPWTETREGIGASGNWNQLLDGINTTYWHSDWSNSVPNHTHYLQVELNEPVYDLIQMKITRRPVSNDHITLWGVWGTNTPEVEDVLWTEDDELPEGVNVGDVKESAWVELASLSTPFGNNTETKISDEFNPQGFKYLRFYIDGTTTGRGYGHVSEFQLVVPVPNPKSQYENMGEVAKNLDTILRDFRSLTDDEITPERYLTLAEAYEAFKALFVDPTELRELLTNVEGVAKGVIVGTAPGFWPDASTGDALKATYEEAKAYDEAGVYVADKSNQYIEILKAQAEAVKAAALKVQVGKWYRIHFGSKETFETNGWDIDTNEATTVTTTEGDVVTNEALWDKYFTVAKLLQETSTYSIPPTEEDGETTEQEITTNHIVAYEDNETIIRSCPIYLDETADIENSDMSLFRFVAVGDTAYVLQNKATGLFVGAYNGVRLDIIPSLFTVQAIGYGQNLIAAKNLVTNASQNNLHAQRSQNVVVTYGESAPGSRSGLYIEEAGDVEGSYDGTEFFMNLKPGSVNSFCFPMDIKAAENYELYDVVGVEEGVIKLNPITQVSAGRPFIFICEGDYVEDAEDHEPYSFYHGYELNKEAIAGPLLKGTYSTVNLPKGALTTHADGFVVGESDVMSLYNVPAYTAYIQGSEMFSLTTDYTYEILDPALPDGMNTVLPKVAATGELYTIDGRLVSRNANLNDLKRFGKGLYILNGVKVVVK